MSGPNAIRGFNFQTAVAVRSALDLLADPHMAAIRVEGAQDIVDLEIIDTADATRHLAQIKARSTTTPWSAAELGAVIAEFAKVNDADQATFAFVTDGHFGPKLAEKLIPALDATAGGISSDEQADLIKEVGAHNATSALLGRLTLLSEQPAVDIQLTLAETEARALIELHEPCDAARARDTVDRLFRLLGLASGQAKPTERIVTRKELADALRVPLSSIDAAGAWDTTARDSYLQAVLDDPLDWRVLVLTDTDAAPPPVTLGVDPLGDTAWQPADGVASPASPAVVTDLLQFAAAGLAGPTGTGKTTSVGLLARSAASTGALPIVVSAADLTGSTLVRETGRAARIRLGRALTPGAGAAMLADADAVLIIDGASDVPAEQRRAMGVELRRVRGDFPALRVIATGRDAGALARMQLPVARLQSPSVDDRLEIAVALTGDADRGREALTHIAKTTGAISAAPLLLVLALADIDAGEPPISRADLLMRFVERLWARADASRADTVTAAASYACASLLNDGQRRPSRYNWIAELGDALTVLAAGNRFDVTGLTGESVAGTLEDAGVFAPPSRAGRVSAAHDLIFDLLAARAFADGTMPWPEHLDSPRWLETAELAAELLDGRLPDELLEAAWSDPQTAAGVGRRSAGTPDDEKATALLRTMIDAHGPDDLRDAALDVRSADALTVAVRNEYAGDTLDDDLLDHAETVITDEAATAPAAVAVRVWTSLIAERLDRRVWDTGGVVAPKDRDEVPAAVEEWWNQRVQAIDAESATFGPVLAERIGDFVRPGLEAWVLPAQTITVGARTRDIIPVAWQTLEAPGVDVHLVDDLPAHVPAESAASIERFLWATPRENAHHFVRGVLSVLLAGLDG